MKKIKSIVIVFLWMRYKKIQLLNYYLKRDSDKKKINACVLKIDGRVHHGGLCDRLKSAVIIYAICKANNIPFKLYFSNPFKLENILKPNKYNWLITDNELTKSILNTKIETSYIGKIKLNFKNRTQIHVYNFGGGYISDVNKKYNKEYTFSSLFEELFKPSEILSEQIKRVKSIINEPYISVTYRFQSLLGDFYEGKYFEKVALKMNKEEKDNLIEISINVIGDIKKEHPNMPILVTSDSHIFLSIINKIKGVYIIPGKIVHMDFTYDETENTYIKSFLDLYMISKAEKIYRVSGKGLYETGFPKVAAFMADKEIKYIKL